MTTIGINISFLTRFFLIITKLILTLIMVVSIVLIFFIGSGVLKPEKSWTLITTEGGLK
ncbi:MAG: hypothetical protein ABIP51_05760 [Bacteroidia bacterium]